MLQGFAALSSLVAILQLSEVHSEASLGVHSEAPGNVLNDAPNEALEMNVESDKIEPSILEFLEISQDESS